MVRHFFTTAIRHFSKYKTHTLLNVFGLALAMACAIFIYTFIVYQLDFDRFHPHTDRTFMIVQDLKLEQMEYSKGGSYAMYSAIKKEVPQIEHITLYIDKQDFTIKANDHLFKTNGKAAFTDASYFDILNFPWLQGDIRQLNELNTAAISTSLAQRYFGTTNVVGKTIWVESKHPVEIVGVIDDSKTNSNFRSELYFSLASIKTLKDIKDESNFNNWGYTHTSNNILMTLYNSENKAIVEKTVHDLVARHWHKDVLQYYTYSLFNIADFHFDNKYGEGTQKSLLAILAVIGFGILAMACINYINMTAAQQLYRSAEMGVRKILGSSNKILFLQFIIETLSLSLVSIILASFLFYIGFNWSNKHLFSDAPIQQLPTSGFIALCLFLWLAIALLTSIIPSLSLQRLQIQAALKKQLSFRWNLSKKALIIFQNTITLLLITGTIVVVSQVHYLKNTDNGYDRSSILLIPIKDDMWKQQEKLSALFRNTSAISSFSFCDNPPSHDKVWGGTIQFDNRAEWETWAPRYAIGDSSYLRTFGIRLLAGTNFNNDSKNPQFLINENMLHKLGYKNPMEVIGKELMAGGLNDNHKGRIVGVVSDFNTNSLKEAISPTVLGYNEERFKHVAIKYTGSSPRQLLKTLEQEWKNLYPDKLFEYRFYDEQIARLYQKEALLEKLIWLAASISIVISILGFIGLLSTVIVKRTKEIGIRKVLGANTTGIFYLLSKDFLQWVIIAFLIAVPISWCILHRWLEDFTFQVPLRWWMFALAGAIGVFITLITISYQSLKAAKTNPVNALRDE